jgi:hypothetical protein
MALKWVSKPETTVRVAYDLNPSSIISSIYMMYAYVGGIPEGVTNVYMTRRPSKGLSVSV